MPQEWFVETSRGEQGPFTAAQLKKLAQGGKIQPTTLVRRGDLEEGRPASSVKGLLLDAPSDAAETARAAARRKRGQHRRATQVRKIRNAGRWLLAVGVLVALVGTWQGIQLSGEAEKIKAQLADEFDEEDVVEAEGEEYTIAELEEQMDDEVLLTYLVNYILAAVLVGLFFWAKRAPLPALITGLCVYLVPHAINAIADPTTLLSGLLWKVIIIVSLLAGIRSAILQRVEQSQADAAPA